MTTVRDGLDAVRDELARLDRAVPALLRPGLSAEQVRELLGDGGDAAVPSELLDWFGWADGTAEEVDQTVDEAAFIPGYVLVSLAEAVEFRDEVESAPDEPAAVADSGHADAVHELEEDEEEADLCWLPLLISPSADFYAAVWPRTGGPVEAAGFVAGASDPMPYASLSLMLRTFVESYRTGAFETDEGGFLDMHPQLCDRVYEAVNRPGAR